MHRTIELYKLVKNEEIVFVKMFYIDIMCNTLCKLLLSLLRTEVELIFQASSINCVMFL